MSHVNTDLRPLPCMDPFTHTLVGLTAAKAGLERLSPLATTVCMLAANSPDSDVVVGFVSDRWDYLHHHRGITHSIVGVIALAFIVPAIIWVGERIFARLRRTRPRTRFRGLLLASLIVTATHPLMDWTNNYGVRPFLPWSNRWFYGDLVFIVDPYILLLVGGAAFLATRRGWPKDGSVGAAGDGICCSNFSGGCASRPESCRHQHRARGAAGWR